MKNTIDHYLQENAEILLVLPQAFQDFTPPLWFCNPLWPWNSSLGQLTNVFRRLQLCGHFGFSRTVWKLFSANEKQIKEVPSISQTFGFFISDQRFPGDHQLVSRTVWLVWSSLTAAPLGLSLHSLSPKDLHYHLLVLHLQFDASMLAFWPPWG